MDKKATGFFAGTIMFLILNIVFFAALLLFIARAGTGADIVEETYSKQIALVIDNMKPGIEISMPLTDLYKKARANNIENPLIIDTSTNRVIVRVAAGAGYEHYYFTKLNSENIVINDDVSGQEVLTIKM